MLLTQTSWQIGAGFDETLCFFVSAGFWHINGGGAFGTLYWADPVEDLIGLLFIQIRPYRHFNIRPLYSNIVTQAVVDSMADQRSKIMGYATPR